MLGEREQAPPPVGPLETGRITVAVLPTVEAAPLLLAIKQEWFSEAGLDVQVEKAGNGPATIAGIVSGDYDIAYSSYVPFIAAHVRQVADLRIITDNSFAAPRTAMIMTSADSPITSVGDLEGSRIAVPGRNTSADLMVKSTMSANNVDHTTVQWVEIPFPNMSIALEQGDVDAAMMVEPFITEAGTAIGATQLVDLATGQLDKLPFTAYGATAQYVDQHPNTIDLFQRVMRRATDTAHDRKRIEPLLPDIANIDENTAGTVSLPGFRSTLAATQVQRIADLMAQFGALPAKFDVTPMLLTP